jgi:hypothetical protein
MRRSFLLAVLLVCTILVANYTKIVYSIDLTVTVETDKPTYNVGETITISGNLTFNGTAKTDGLVGVEIDDPDNYPIAFRTLCTGTIPSGLWKVMIIDAYIGDIYQNPVTNVRRGSQCYIWIHYNNSAGYPLNALITLTILDSKKACLFTSASIEYVQPGGPFFTMIQWAVPEDAELGTASIYGNAYTSYPRNRGTPYCPEKSSTFSIVSSGGLGVSTDKDFASMQVPGGFEAFLCVPKYGARLGNYTVYATSFIYVPPVYLAFDSTTFQVVLAGDLNNDGRVDIFDVVIIGIAFNSSPPSDPRADVNKDGKVDIFDLVIVALHYGEWGRL